MRGNPPKSPVVHRLQGTARARNNRNVPRPSAKMPACPRWLSAEAKAEWKRVAPELFRCGLLTALDGDALAIYCEAYSTWLWAAQTVQQEGATYRTEGGLVKRHPAAAILSTARKDMLAWADRLGLTPASRQRLHVEPPPPDGDEFEALLNKGRFFPGPGRVVTRDRGRGETGPAEGDGESA